MINQSPLRTSLINVEDYRAFYESALTLPLEEISNQFTETCELRSHEMARYTYELAKNEKAQIVYMSFGALHTHGVLEELKKYPAYIIVFSPNY